MIFNNKLKCGSKCKRFVTVVYVIKNSNNVGLYFGACKKHIWFIATWVRKHYQTTGIVLTNTRKRDDNS